MEQEFENIYQATDDIIHALTTQTMIKDAEYIFERVKDIRHNTNLIHNKIVEVIGNE